MKPEHWDTLIGISGACGLLIIFILLIIGVL
jgi:hypothetical protein